MERFTQLAARPLAPGLAGLPAGLAAPWMGWQLMRGHPKLWRGTLTAVAIQSVLTLALLAGWGVIAWHWLRPFTDGLAWYSVAGRWVLAGLAFTVGLFVVSALGMVLGMALTPFAYGALAEKVERVLGGDVQRWRPLSNWAQGVEAVRAVVELVLVNGVLLALGLFPVFSVPCAVLGFLYNAWTLGLNCLEYGQVLRGIARPARKARGARFRGATLGLGAGAVLWSSIPVVGAFLTAAAVAGGGILIRRMEKEEEK